MRIVWVIGSRGLLGNALCQACREAGDLLFTPHLPFAWSDQARLLAQFEAAVHAFAASVGEGDTWEVYWAAGIGTFASSADDMLRETAALGALLGLLETNAVLRATPGAIGFASSAGALYAAALDKVITEETDVSPTTPYAHAKLQQEALVQAFSARQGRAFTLVARISTLYGAGQSLGKKQGLLTHIARSIVRNKPIQIYVPFDTIRDYIAVTDAAARMIAAVRQPHGQPRCLTQLVASEEPTTIAEIIATFKRVSRRTPLVVTSVSRNTALYTRRVHFRSIVAAPPPGLARTSLMVGIGRLLQAERYQFAQPAA